MVLKYILPIFLVLSCLGVQSQTLLDADSSNIYKAVALQGGGLKTAFIEKNIEINGYYKKMVFQYPSPLEGNACLMRTTFCLTMGNKCFKYYEEYWGDELANKKIDELKKNYPGLNRVKKEWRWVDKWAEFEIDLIPKKSGNNNFASVYVLEIKKLQ